MKHGTLTIIVFLYFVGSITYMLSYPTNHAIIQTTVYSWLRAGYYILQYGVMFALACGLTKHIFYSLDILSLLFFKIYVCFKLVMFSFLLAKYLPTYIAFLDSKLITLLLSLFILVFTVILFFLNYDRYKKFLG